MKKVKRKDEISLMNGERKRADQLGWFYYISLNEDYRKAKGIIDIKA